MVRAPATTPDEVRCHGCGRVSPHVTVEVSRRYGWRVGWTPQQPSWCPECYNGEKKPRPKSWAPAPYDEPLPL